MKFVTAKNIDRFKTRTVNAKLKLNGGEEVAIKMSRLPVDEMINFISLFSGVLPDGSNFLDKDRVKTMIKLMKKCILSANTGLDEEDVSEFVATNFFSLVEPFLEVNGGELDLNIPDDVRRMMNEQ